MPRRVKLFKEGDRQSVRIPADLELPGDEAIIRKEGSRVVLEPVPPRSLVDLLARLQPIDETFAGIDDLPPEALEL